MVLDSGMKKFLEAQIREFMDELEETVQIGGALKIEHMHDFIFGYLYGAVIALAYEYINGDHKKKRVDLSYEEFNDIFTYISQKRDMISDALYYRGLK